MANFLLLAGNHQNGSRRWKQGEVVESDDDLVKIHGSGKFSRVADPVVVVKEVIVEKVVEVATEKDAEKEPAKKGK